MFVENYDDSQQHLVKIRDAVVVLTPLWMSATLACDTEIVVCRRYLCEGL